jgi:hypothetical protein
LMHILIPSMVMKEVGNIKEKLLDSVALYYQNMANTSTDAGKEGVESKDGDDAAVAKYEEKKPFNAAKYLFLSYRMAKLYPELKVAKIISQFSTPWPKQSYHRVVDVSKEYDGRFSAISRSVSMVAMFFLTNLLSVPLGMQDMIMQMVTTTAIGYTTLFHIQLYQIYPILVIIPALFIGGIIHFVVRSTRANGELEQRMFLKRKVELPKDESKQSGVGEIDDYDSEDFVLSDDSDSDKIDSKAQDAQLHQEDIDSSALRYPSLVQSEEWLNTSKQHSSRRQSVAYGISLALQATQSLFSPSSKESEHDESLDVVSSESSNISNNTPYTAVKYFYEEEKDFSIDTDSDEYSSETNNHEEEEQDGEDSSNSDNWISIGVNNEFEFV